MTDRLRIGVILLAGLVLAAQGELRGQQEAEGIWNFALSLYDRITDPLMQDVRDGGRAAILQKLEHFGARHAA